MFLVVVVRERMRRKGNRGEDVDTVKRSLDLPPEPLELLAAYVQMPCKLIGSPVRLANFRQA